MSVSSTNIGLTLTPASDSSVPFSTWRLLVNGDGSTSNAQIIDAEIGALKSSLCAIETSLAEL